ADEQQRLLAALYERLSRPAEALLASERARDTGVFDVDVLALRARALRALGRTGEARAAEADLASLAPEESLAPAGSPLTGAGGRLPLPRAAERRRR
ncbi:MAG TPA: hypothetical protein PK598_11760, partial [Thermoanaerobaculia bacterium]|nr:hypothetical protein [Thermoanaerobaculia bacterium]